MRITCPQCEFSREVTEGMLPLHVRTATCPVCQHRFALSREKLTTEQHNGTEICVEAQEKASFKKEPYESTEKQVFMEHELVESEKAAAAYQEQAEQGGKTEQAKFQPSHEDASASFAIQNPWEYHKDIGFLSAFFQTVMRVCFAPARFFVGFQANAPKNLALIFYLIVSILQVSCERFWAQAMVNYLAPMAANDPQLQQLLGMFASSSSFLHVLLMSTVFSIAELFVAAGFYFFMFKVIVANRADFSLIFQITAYGVAPVLLCIVPGIGSLVGFIWSIACTTLGFRYAMHLTWPQTLLGVLPFYLIVIPLLLRFTFAFAV